MICVDCKKEKTRWAVAMHDAESRFELNGVDLVERFGPGPWALCTSCANWLPGVTAKEDW